MTTLRARMLYPVASPPLEDGMVCVGDGAIRSWGRWDGRKAEDLGDVVLMPGLINAHCHLDYSVMRGAILPNASFSQWIRRLNDLKRTLSDDDYLASIAAGFRALLASGTTSVFNIESFPELMPRIPRSPLRTWWFYEMMDVRNRIHTEEAVAEAVRFFEARKEGFGLSPHAPYTASQPLYRMARACGEKYGIPVMTHLAESDEEFEMFRHARGPLHDFLKDMGRDMSDAGGLSPVARLIGGDALPDGALLTHMNTLAEGDWEHLHGRNFSIIHCPGCHEYFGRDPFPIGRFLREGHNLCLGTDSLASNRALNLFAEMRCLSRKTPGLTPEALIEFVTRNPARAIGLPGRLGEISCGAAADLIALPYSGSLSGAAEAITNHTGRVEWVMVGGKLAKY
ncbi:MAG: amidohydrolase family protein [Verrucomicrobiae bacterium]